MAKRDGNMLRLGIIAALAVVTTLAGWTAEDDEDAGRNAEEIQQGEQIKAQVLAEAEIIEGTQFNEIMNEVFARLVGVPDVSARDLPYEIFLVRSDEANAFCTPGGKVIVYSGMTSIVRHDPDLWAALLSHELAHAVESHSHEEQQSKKKLGWAKRLLAVAGGLAPGLGQADKLATVAKHAETAGRVGNRLQLLSPFLARKFSRDNELEADERGMGYMASAGFDPAAAIRLHQEITERFGDSKPLSTFLSTHPREKVRIKELEQLLPAVQQEATLTSSTASIAMGRSR